MDSTEHQYDYISMDITSNCNLRCPFCFNDFSKIKGNTFISDELFDKCLSLLPLVPDGRFLFSCLFEPTLNPEFIRLLKKIPEEYGSKVFFSTNLCKRLSDDAIEELSRLKINYINISMDSLRPEHFERFRKNSKSTVFFSNLERIADVFSKKADPPALHFTTMVVKSNIDEMAELLTHCATNYPTRIHEFRMAWHTPFNHRWLNAEAITRQEWSQLERDLALIPYPHQVSPYVPSPDFPEPDEFPRPEQDHESTVSSIYHVPTEIALLISSDGTVRFASRNESTNLKYISDPHHLFKDILPILRLDRERALKLQSMGS